VELTLLPIATTRSCFTLQIKLAINSETSAKYFMIYYISAFREKWPLQGTPQTILHDFTIYPMPLVLRKVAAAKTVHFFGFPHH